MNKYNYIKQLNTILSEYTFPNKYEVLSLYESKINDILLSNNNDFSFVINELDYPSNLAHLIIQEYNLSKKPIEKLVQQHRSNALWNLILVFYHAFSLFLAFITITLISLIFYFGFDSSASIYNYKLNNVNIHQIQFCGNNQCNKYQLRLNETPFDDSSLEPLISFKNGIELQLSKCSKTSICLVPNDYTSTFRIHYGFLAIITTILLVLIMRVLYIFVYRNVMCNIISNNEYNRRYRNE